MDVRGAVNIIQVGRTRTLVVRMAGRGVSAGAGTVGAVGAAAAVTAFAFQVMGLSTHASTERLEKMSHERDRGGHDGHGGFDETPEDETEAVSCRKIDMIR